MMNFEFTNRALQQAHRAGALPLIGKGSFALVFEMDERRVLKVTCDPANAAMLSSQDRSLKPSPAFPVVFEDRGIVGECEDCLYHAYVKAISMTLRARALRGQYSRSLRRCAEGTASKPGHRSSMLPICGNWH